MGILRQLRSLSRLEAVSRRSSSVLARPASPGHQRQVVGNDYHYEEVNRNFKWNIPEDWNFTADVIDKFGSSAEDK